MNQKEAAKVLLQMPDAEYRRAEGMNWSKLKAMADSPLLYAHRQRHPRADTASMALGRAVHAAVLEPEVYTDRWVVYDGTRRGKAWESFQMMHDGQEIITASEAMTVENIVARLQLHDDAMALLSGEGVNERCAFWEEGGRRMKAKIDRVTGSVVVDLKTTKSVDPSEFARSADTFGYVGQMDHYATGVELLTGRQYTAILLAVENTAPYDVGVFRISPEARLMGRQYRHKLLRQLDDCERTGHWPGRVPQMADLEIPRWSKLRS